MPKNCSPIRGGTGEKIDASDKIVYIAGAGIAGLTLALALAKSGVKSVILEKTKYLQSQGAGLQISPNARNVLNYLGLSTSLDKLGFAPAAIDIYPFLRQKPLVSIEIGDAVEKKFGSPYIVIHRADLAEILFQACIVSNLIEVHFNIVNFDLATHANGFSVSVEHGDGHIQEARPFAFIGADGVHSITRTKILSGPDAIYTGYTAWRALIPTSLMKVPLNLDNTSLLWGPGFHAVTYPHPKRHVINVALFCKEPEQPRTKQPQTKNKTSAPNLPKIALTCPRFKAIIEASEGAWSKWPLYGVKTRHWHKGSIGLIGDAAHAMLPFQAQGAAMAIEDAAVLAPILASETEPQIAFSKYYKARKRRVTKIAATSASNGEIYHMIQPFSLARDLAVLAQGSSTALKRLAWIYEHKTAPQENPKDE